MMRNTFRKLESLDNVAAFDGSWWYEDYNDKPIPVRKPQRGDSMVWTINGKKVVPITIKDPTEHEDLEYWAFHMKRLGLLEIATQVYHDTWLFQDADPKYQHWVAALERAKTSHHIY